MSELAGFLDDIRANPEDVTPRLIAADWYEDQGDAARAEFIRLQCQLESCPPYERDPAQERQMDRLIRKHGKAWAGPVAPLGRPVWSRGFIDSISCRAAVFLDQAATLVGATTREISLERANRYLNELIACSQLSTVRALAIRSLQMTQGDFRRLFNSPHLGRLRQLTLNQCHIDSELLDLLVNSPLIHQLTHLDLANNGELGTSIAALAHLPANSLRGLKLRSCGVGEAGVEVLAHAGNLTNLRELDLAYGILPESAGRILASSPYLRQLEVLDLHFSNLNLGGAVGLAGSPVLGRVRELEIGFNEITDLGVQALCQSPHLSRLVKLNISHSEGTSALGGILADSRLLPQLRWLALHYNDLRDEGLTRLVASPGVANLVHLDLRSCGINSEGFVALAASPYLGQLRSLALTGNHVTVKGVNAIIRSPHLSKLWRLHITPHDTTSTGIARLRKHFGPALVQQ